MNIKFDYTTRQVFIEEKPYSLDDLETFILKYWLPLAIKYRIKPINSNGNILYTYDWHKIYSIAVEGGMIIEEFLDKHGVFNRPHAKELRQINLFE